MGNSFRVSVALILSGIHVRDRPGIRRGKPALL